MTNDQLGVPDLHVHSQWSWDALAGDMTATCERAVELGLPAVAFTEHVDHTVWQVALDELDDDHVLARLSTTAGQLVPPAFDAVGYLAAVDACRARFPDLRVLSGLELGEPHRHTEQVASVLAAGRFDHVLGSVHSLSDGDGYAEPPALLRQRSPGDVLRAYLDEVVALVVGSDTFTTLAHIDYAVRTWPGGVSEFRPEDFEEEFRRALRVTADSGRALEVNTVVPLHSVVLGWWRDEGGTAVTISSDAHDPAMVGRRLRDAAHMAEAYDFRPGRHPFEPWPRG